MFDHERHLAIGLCLCSLVFLAARAERAAAEVPPDVAGKIAAIGRTIDFAKSAPLYSALHEPEPYAGIDVQREVKYAAEERNVLDVFRAAATGAPRPILIFVHGGGFVAGNKRLPNSPFYDNVPLWAARNGMVGINMSYRLAPSATWPSGAQDVARAVEWVMVNPDAHGGDRSRVYLMGCSAGATHVAAYVADARRAQSATAPIAGAILLSGIYDLTTFELPDSYQLYFGKDARVYSQRSSLPGLLHSPVPLMVTLAQFDPPSFARQARQLHEALCNSARGCQAFVELPAHNHLTQVLAINTDDTTLTRHVLKFVR